MPYAILLAEDVEKFLAKVGAGEEERITKRLEKLKGNPYHYLERKGDTWIMKVGSKGYRIAVDVDDQKQEIRVLFVQKRSRFYREFDV